MKTRSTAKRPRNRAAQDTTLINLRALKTRVAELETFRRAHREELIGMRNVIAALTRRVTAIERGLP